jgi:transcriptional regulator with XRE-family HTH domain
LSELKDIRKALNLNQEEMGKLFGVKQGVYQRWEVAEDSEASRTALEKAKEFYQKKIKSPWESRKSNPIESPLQAEIIEVRAALKAHIGYWERGEEKVLRRLEDAHQRISQLEKQVSDLQKQISK